MIYIFARSHQDAERCAELNQLTPNRWSYISSPERIMGTTGATIWYFSDWWRHPQAHRIEQEIRVRGSRGGVTMTAPNNGDPVATAPVWACPGCGYLVPDKVVHRARHDYACPSCRGYNTSQFSLSWV